MRLRTYIVIGYLMSMLITIAGLIVGLNQMLITIEDISYILVIALIASVAGGIVNMILLSNVFSSLKRLKKKIQAISERNFDSGQLIKCPLEFKDLEEAFNQMSSELKVSFESLSESEHEKSMMIAQLSHDIKTPLTSIQATVEGMLDGVIPKAEERHYLNTISRQTNRLNQLVEELHVVSLNDQQQEQRPLQIIYLEELLIDILSEFQLTLEQEKRSVHIEVAKEVVKISSRYDALSRIMLNLVSNALKYSKANTALTIHAYQQEQSIRIDVIDQGQGIKKEDLPLIFKRLYRVEASRNMKTGGHGLGLSIARQLARQLGGDIAVESQLGKGSCFSLLLPASPPLGA
ncbi:TPA: HAMP domain-containing histidine kinase [Streptococcus equi subsp. zooepidemicus]|uniref:sensor histidine kinase n=1 Tax=Streptococcus equi TaxID=1336 RepID=UPI0013F5B0F8|nr:HAMP domain-containing sensor histidine kinase [Streptococcus equi]HEL1015973.1 HAMP domain-containing histidine kinase [Streptococcus equi subsp. ruminatorum]MCD3382249.1 HAMP domain-containing histidine kinase [Streptococcus equi subsp. zooepidemicus]MCD3419862.1 HAMP domain-containing histidine kinase [Streptococcus equi subsp. zooepidemicus]MCD3426311.1 HAMP domain-containing histidine kinase [Streptococcus equi subsp. zooepidemicus]MDI6000918.1 HAMP domain-containing sensor histidine k